MALVIFCVALVEAMRTRMSLREAISSQSPSITTLVRSVSCPASCRAFTSSVPSTPQGVDGRDRPGHDGVSLGKRLREALHHALELGGEVVAEVAGVADAVEQVGVL